MLGTFLTATVDYLGSSLLFGASAPSAAPSPRCSGCAASLVSQGTAGYLCIVCLLLCSRPCPAHTLPLHIERKGAPAEEVCIGFPGWFAPATVSTESSSLTWRLRKGKGSPPEVDNFSVVAFAN